MSCYIFWHYTEFPFLPASHPARVCLLFWLEVSPEEMKAAMSVGLHYQWTAPAYHFSKQAGNEAGELLQVKITLCVFHNLFTCLFV